MSPEIVKKMERNAKAKAGRQEKAAKKVAQKAASTSANVLRKSDDSDSEHDDPKTAHPRKKSRTETPTPNSDVQDISAYVLVTSPLSSTLKVPACGKVANALPKVIPHGLFFFGVHTTSSSRQSQQLLDPTDSPKMVAMVMSIGERIKDHVIEVWIPPQTKSLDVVPVGWYTGKENQVPEVDYDEILNPPQTMSIQEQMAGLDVATSPGLTVLREHYPIGRCPLFPNIHVYKSGDNHWELNDLRLQIWAVHMGKGATNIDCPPASAHFAHDKWLRVSSAATTASTGPLVQPCVAFVNNGRDQNLFTQHLLFQNQQLTNQIQSFEPFQMPFTNPCFAGPTPQFGFGGYPVQHLLHTIPASRDVPEHPRKVTLDKFCHVHKVLDSDFAKLQALDYVPGDCGVETLPREDWSSAGFVTLSWDQFLKKHHAFIKDVCNIHFV
ncbi:hypothetical protein GLOTRDRAFT_129290 [Gloeophyllum trabeum ATCC 11539]|uniref:Uncharacterized protein n=1 Tax=Gloeophyllum trabeum (strain ATCC 11539 / FP-39264 / Madison 617) TaxID=670483 RepID=S7Q4Q2_GLOTA|nr:uncharacterized protein GLOTRDRAFT_129290 [Gloeophyllum trabeum ATCC 11539]EPQ54981.1 hypothetical protein GLOTRDRAFT_129290 [Gloeophyllum trabeum ATCC 11539]